MSVTLKAARVNRGLSQSEAAEKLEISQKTLSGYENGRAFPDVPTIQKILDLYEVGYDDINFFPRSTIKM